MGFLSSRGLERPRNETFSWVAGQKQGAPKHVTLSLSGKGRLEKGYPFSARKSQKPQDVTVWSGQGSWGKKVPFWASYPFVGGVAAQKGTIFALPLQSVKKRCDLEPRGWMSSTFHPASYSNFLAEGCLIAVLITHITENFSISSDTNVPFIEISCAQYAAHSCAAFRSLEI